MVLTNKELKDGLVDMIIFVKTIWLHQGYCLEDLYNTGCRYNELYQRDRISEYDINTYQIITEKGSYPRLIPKNAFTDFFHDNLTIDSTSFIYARHSTAQRIIRECFPFGNVMVGNRGCSTHLFRYNYIRVLNDGGMSAEDIASLIGEVEIANITAYINNPITYT